MLHRINIIYMYIYLEHPETYVEPLYEGEVSLVGCRVKYQSAPHADINPEHIPKLEGYIYTDSKMTDFELMEYNEYYEARMVSRV